MKILFSKSAQQNSMILHTHSPWISVNQSGFRSGYSWESCLLKITNKWYNAINNDKVVGCVALDLTKAFDVLNFNIFIKKA